jgi:hypothetical protein
VPVCLVNPVKDVYSGANFPAGQQTVEGSAALAFVRQRHGLPNSDLDRIKRQQVFMASMAHTVLSAGVLTSPGKLDSLIDAIHKSITLDTGWDVLGFAQQMQSMTAGNIQFLTVPIVSITLKTPEDGDAVEVDPEQVQSFVQSAIGSSESSPTSSAAPPPTTTNNQTANADITAEVYNATGRSGLASEVLQTLTGAGFASGGTGNSATRSSSVVDYSPGDSEDAQKVVAALGGGIRTVSSSVMSSGTVRVYLGRDYSGPKGSVSTGTDTGSSAGTATTAPKPKPVITAGTQNCIN